ncbi:hypothetical protein KC315_g6734 [Hortaea werneckii]|nr:hypothetical protein KC315_g6734 [Hortaea werneckii]
MRLSGGHAMPLEDIQEIVDDHESDSWTLAQVFRRTKDLKTAVDAGVDLSKRAEELQRAVAAHETTIADHESTIAEQQTTIADRTTALEDLKQTNSRLESQKRQLRDELRQVKDELDDSISLEEHQARLDSHADEVEQGEQQAIEELQQEHAEKMADAEASWRDKLDTAKEKLSLAVNEKSGLESQVVSLEGSLGQSKAEYDYMKMQLETRLEQDETAATEAMQKLEEDKEKDRKAALAAQNQLQQSLDHQYSLRGQDRTTIEDLKQRVKEECERYNTLEGTRAKMAEDSDKMRQELTHLRRRQPELDAEVDSTRQALTRAEEEKSRLAVQLEQEQNRTQGLHDNVATLRYESNQLQEQREQSKEQIVSRDQQIREKNQQISNLKDTADRLERSEQETNLRAEEETSSLRRVLQALLPVVEGQLTHNLVCDNLIKGVCRAKPAHATQTINPRAAPGYVWDVGLVLPEELASVELDESLPRRLWVRTCSTNEPRPSMVMVEACLLWFWRGRQYTPEDTRFMMAAAEIVVGHCRQASEAKDEAMLCSLARLALRIMELCLRSGVERSELGAMFWDFKELTVTSFCNRGDALTCALWDWVNSTVLLGTTPTSVPETLLQVAEMEEKDTVSDTDDPSLPRFMIASAGKSLLVDKAEGFVTELVEDEVDYTFMIPMGYRFTFRKGRRLRDNMDYRLPMLLGRDQYATFPYLVVHLPSVVDRRFEEVFPGAREEFEQLHGYPMLQGVPMQAPL